METMEDKYNNCLQLLKIECKMTALREKECIFDLTTLLEWCTKYY